MTIKRIVGALFLVAAIFLVVQWVHSGELPGDLRRFETAWINLHWLLTIPPAWILAVVGLSLLDLPTFDSSEGPPEANS